MLVSVICSRGLFAGREIGTSDSHVKYSPCAVCFWGPHYLMDGAIRYYCPGRGSGFEEDRSTQATRSVFCLIFFKLLSTHIFLTDGFVISPRIPRSVLMARLPKQSLEAVGIWGWIVKHCYAWAMPVQASRTILASRDPNPHIQNECQYLPRSIFQMSKHQLLFTLKRSPSPTWCWFFVFLSRFDFQSMNFQVDDQHIFEIQRGMSQARVYRH
jgi:hypothetical protein